MLNDYCMVAAMVAATSPNSRWVWSKAAYNSLRTPGGGEPERYTGDPEGCNALLTNCSILFAPHFFVRKCKGGVYSQPPDGGRKSMGNGRMQAGPSFGLILISSPNSHSSCSLHCTLHGKLTCGLFIALRLIAKWTNYLKQFSHVKVCQTVGKIVLMIAIHVYNFARSVL